MPHLDKATLEMIRNILEGVTIPEKANIANQVGEDSVGTASIPIYWSNGVPVAATPSSMSVAAAQYLSRAADYGTTFTAIATNPWYGFCRISSGSATSAYFSITIVIHNTVEDIDNMLVGIVQLNGYIDGDGKFDTDNTEISVLAGNIDADKLLIIFSDSYIVLYHNPSVSNSSASRRIFRVTELSRYVSNTAITVSLGISDFTSNTPSTGTIKYAVRRNVASELNTGTSSIVETSDGVLSVNGNTFTSNGTANLVAGSTLESSPSTTDSTTKIATTACVDDKISAVFTYSDGTLTITTVKE